MKKKFILALCLTAFLVVALAICVQAASTDEFGTPETLSNIDMTGMSTDTEARVVIKRADGQYYTYPSSYVLTDSTTFTYSFNAISTALGEAITKESVIRIEVPNDILVIPTYCATSPAQSNTLREVKFLPDSQCHTFGYGCFFQNKNMQRLNVPKNVVNISTLVINQSKIEELIFEDGFSTVLPKDSFKGASGVKKVVFSNQMTTVTDRALDSTLGESLEEFYFGAGLLDLGTNNMAWVKQSVKFYISEQFLSEADAITMETFSWWNSSACLPTGVVFYSGTRAQMEALIEKSTYNRVICKEAELVEWDSSKSDDEYVPAKGWTIVYGYNKCKAFYGNEHEEQVLNSCQFGCTRGCGVVALLDNPQHEYMLNVTYGGEAAVDYYKLINATETCKVCNHEGVNVNIDPLFTDKGYSVDLTSVGISQSFKVNKEAIALYKEYVDKSFEYGVVASIDNSNPLILENGKIKAVGKAIASGMGNTDFELFNIKVVGIPENYASAKIVGCAYTVDRGEIYYLSENQTASEALGISYEELKAKA